MSFNKLTLSTVIFSSFIITGCSSTSSVDSVTPELEQPKYTLADQARDAYAARVDSDWGVEHDLQNPIEKDEPVQPKYSLVDLIKDTYAQHVDKGWEFTPTPSNPIQIDPENPIIHVPENPIETPDYGDTPEFGFYKVVYDNESGQLKVYDRRNDDATVAIFTVEDDTLVVRHGAMESDNTYALIRTEDGIAIDWENPHTKIDGDFGLPIASENMDAFLAAPLLTEQQLQQLKLRIASVDVKSISAQSQSTLINSAKMRTFKQKQKR